jgi:endonuclease G
MVRRPRNGSGLFGLLGLVLLLVASLLFQRRRSPGPRAEPARGDGAGHLELGLPRDGDDADDLVLRRPQYVISYNPRRNVANWASFRLVASDFGDTPRRKGEFLEDPQLPAGVLRVTHRDYARSGFDRGHLVRSADRTASRTDNDATFFMTNVVPQRHGLNEGAWLRFEEHCTKLARSGRQVFVVTGPIFDDPKGGRTIGPGVRVPDALFKIAVVLEPGQGHADVRASTTVLAVAMPNVDSAAPRWEAYRTTIDAVEAKTGYDFLDAVAPEVQAVVEAR